MAKIDVTQIEGYADMTAEEICREALKIASSICVYTNDHISVEKL